jgi:hypothetical protein
MATLPERMKFMLLKKFHKKTKSRMCYACLVDLFFFLGVPVPGATQCMRGV